MSSEQANLSKNEKVAVDWENLGNCLVRKI